MDGTKQPVLAFSFDGTKDINLRKKRMKKSLFGAHDLKKCYVGPGDEWATKFVETVIYADALRALKQVKQIQRHREAINEKYDTPYTEENKLSPVQKAKRDEKRTADLKRLKMQERQCEEHCAKLEDALIDHKIKQAEASIKGRKASKGIAGLAVAAGKVVAGQAQRFAGEEGHAAIEGAKRGSQLAHQAMHKPKAPKVPAVKSEGYEPMATKGVKELVGKVRSFASEKKHEEKPARSSTLKFRQAGQRSGFAYATGANKSVSKADNSPDADIDAGQFGIADYGATGEVAMRVKPNMKCNGCGHYQHDHTACMIGVVPSVCGDGSFPEIGYAPATPNRIAAKNATQLHADAVAIPAQAENHTIIQEIPYRIEVLGDSALTLSERMSLLKSAYQAACDLTKANVTPEKARKILHDKKVHGKTLTEQQRKYFGAVASGTARKADCYAFAKSATEDFMGERLVIAEPALKSTSIKGFADAVGTTVDVVRDIARRLGSRQDFAEFIKSKLPDIMMAHGLDEAAVSQLYRQAVRLVKSLSDAQWMAWKGFDFSAGVTDEALAQAINRNGGLLDNNIVHGSVTASEPTTILPDPEPIQRPQQEPIPMGGFVGGNLHLADSISRLN
jgi:hypothetical protein